MPEVTVTRPVKAVELMAAMDPGQVLIDVLRQLGTDGAQAARNAGAAADTPLLPKLTLQLVMRWE